MKRIPHSLPPMTRRLFTLLATLCALSVGVPAVAAAATGGGSGTAQQAISDCNSHDQLTRHYSAAALRQALASMPADVKEYTDCYDVIERQLLTEVGKTTAATPTTSSSSSGSFLPTWLIIVIVILALAAVTFGAISIRNRGGGPPGPPPAGPGDPGGPAPPAGA
jgi:hypothetical protein